MGVWDALGQGVQAGVNAYLAGKLRQDERTQEAEMQKLREAQLALQQFQARQGMEQWEQEQSLAEQERARQRQTAFDPRFIEEGFYIPMYDELSPGVFVPIAAEERYQRYLTQRAAQDERSRGLASEELARQKELAEYEARMRHQYSYPPSHIEQQQAGEPNFFFPDGTVNPKDASAFLRNFITFYNIDPASGPLALERFADEVDRCYRNVPDARNKAIRWYLNQSEPTVTGGAGGQEGGPGFLQRLGEGISGLIERIPGEPRTFGARNIPEPVTAAPSVASTDPQRMAIEQSIRSAFPDWPEEMIRAKVEEEYRKLLRSQPSAFNQAAQAAQSAMGVPSVPNQSATPQQQAAAAMRQGWNNPYWNKP